MTQLHRRSLLSIAALGAPIALIGCQSGGTPGSGPPASESASQALADASAIVGSLTNTVDQIIAAQPTLIPANLVPQIKGWLTQAQAGLSSLSVTVDQQKTAAALQQVSADVQNVLQTLSGVTAIPEPYLTVIRSANILLPAVVAFIQTTLLTINPRIAALPHRVGSPLEVSMARAKLNAAARRGR